MYCKKKSLNIKFWDSVAYHRWYSYHTLKSTGCLPIRFSEANLKIRCFEDLLLRQETFHSVVHFRTISPLHLWMRSTKLQRLFKNQWVGHLLPPPFSRCFPPWQKSYSWVKTIFCSTHGASGETIPWHYNYCMGSFIVRAQRHTRGIVFSFNK